VAFDSIEANLLLVFRPASGGWGSKPVLALLGLAELSSLMSWAPIWTLLEGPVLQRCGLQSEFLHRLVRKRTGWTPPSHVQMSRHSRNRAMRRMVS